MDNRAFAPFFQRLIDDPGAALRALQQDAAGFEASLFREEGGALRANGSIPAHGALRAVVFDRSGARVAAGHDAPFPAVGCFADLPDSDRPAGHLMTLAGAADFPVHAIWAPIAETAGWNLPSSVRALAADHPDGRLLLIAGAANDEGPLDAACRAFNLTDLQVRVIKELIRTGSARGASEKLGLSHATVREAISHAARRIGAANQPDVVRTIVAAAFGVLPDEGDPASILSDMLQLTPRQAMIAVAIASGVSREDCAAVAGVSAAVVKKELEVIFSLLGVATATELSRLVVEVQALRLLSRSTVSMPGLYDAATEPTRLMPRPNGNGRIAWSDYGPRSGKPVLVVHSNWSCRAVPRPLVVALHRAGYRPIAIDRPGFGLSTLGRSTADDPFNQAVEDTLTVLDTLGIDRLPVIARCGAQFVLVLKHRAPGRLDRVLLVSPTPQTSDTGRRQGIVGVVKEAFYRSPRMIEFFFRIISAQVSLARTETLTRAIVAGCATDTALCDDPVFLRDRLRAIRPLSTGRMTGAVFEERIISHGGYDFAPLDADDWTVLQGELDPHNDVAEVTEYWSRLLPRARFQVVSDGGRFMTSSHPEMLAKLLS